MALRIAGTILVSGLLGVAGWKLTQLMAGVYWNGYNGRRSGFDPSSDAPTWFLWFYRVPWLVLTVGIVYAMFWR